MLLLSVVRSQFARKESKIAVNSNTLTFLYSDSRTCTVRHIAITCTHVWEWRDYIPNLIQRFCCVGQWTVNANLPNNDPIVWQPHKYICSVLASTEIDEVKSFTDTSINSSLAIQAVCACVCKGKKEVNTRGMSGTHTTHTDEVNKFSHSNRSKYFSVCFAFQIVLYIWGHDGIWYWCCSLFMSLSFERSNSFFVHVRSHSFTRWQSNPSSQPSHRR